MAEHEDEDLQRLKDWWRSNGLALVLGALVGLAAIGGWQGWQAYRDSQARAASASYDELQRLLQSDDAKPQAIVDRTEQLQSNHGGSPYAAQAGLAAADYFVQREDYARAGEQLRWVIDYAEQPPMRHLARVRRARLFWAQGKPDEALALLGHAHPPAFVPLYAELSGDIHAAAGDNAKAEAAYRRALGNLPAGADSAPLQRKLDDVAGAAGQDDGREVS